MPLVRRVQPTDEIELDDPAVDVVDMICLNPKRWPLIGQFLSCNTIYPAPAEAHTLTTFPRCGVYAFAQTYLEATTCKTDDRPSRGATVG